MKLEAIQCRTSPDKGLKQDCANENREMRALVDISAGLGSYLGSFLDRRVAWWRFWRASLAGPGTTCVAFCVKIVRRKA